MTIIERVAIAISGAPFPSKVSLRKAPAAIEAMREPTDAMVSVGIGGAEGVKRRLWELMIAAALNEQVAG